MSHSASARSFGNVGLFWKYSMYIDRYACGGCREKVVASKATCLVRPLPRTPGGCSFPVYTCHGVTSFCFGMTCCNASYECLCYRFFGSVARGRAAIGLELSEAVLCCVRSFDLFTICAFASSAQKFQHKPARLT